MSLPFVHTTRRYYRLTVLARSLDWSPCGRQRSSGILRETVPTWSVRGSKSRNKVSVGEPAEGSLMFLFRMIAFHLCSPKLVRERNRVCERLCALGGCARHFFSSVGLCFFLEGFQLTEEQLPIVDPLARTSMKTVAKCDIVLRIAERTWHLAGIVVRYVGLRVV